MSLARLLALEHRLPSCDPGKPLGDPTCGGRPVITGKGGATHMAAVHPLLSPTRDLKGTEGLTSLGNEYRCFWGIGIPGHSVEAPVWGSGLRGHNSLTHDIGALGAYSRDEGTTIRRVDEEQRFSPATILPRETNSALENIASRAPTRRTEKFLQPQPVATQVGAPKQQRGLCDYYISCRR